MCIVQFTVVDRSSRTQTDFVSFLMRKLPYDGINVARMRYNRQQAIKRKNYRRASARGRDGDLSLQAPSQGTPTARWWWCDLTKEQYSK